ncbi:hypothetical protein JD844_020026 [Phrynosoma platyrhinos]|uniref:Uncharacterized protein n=1 Tax=Phrynosoma platyrhinos TaxID=52577 RepID=A0ABQ7TQP0_PHRPL|nr:hypothetical protein JD844_020026 [Phrynosoma platyrhinos]
MCTCMGGVIQIKGGEVLTCCHWDEAVEFYSFVLQKKNQEEEETEQELSPEEKRTLERKLKKERKKEEKKLMREAGITTKKEVPKKPSGLELALNYLTT